MKHNIIKQLESLAVDISTVLQDPANARKHGARNLDAVKASLASYGQRKPIVVRASTRVVEAGNGTLAAALAMGWTHIAAALIDDDEITAARYAIADNRSAELAEWDADALATTLSALALEGVDLDGLGFSDEDFASVLELSDNLAELEDGDDARAPSTTLDGVIINDPASEWRDLPEFVQRDAFGRKIIIHFERPEYVEAFAALIGQEITPATRYLYFPRQERDSVAGLAFVARPLELEDEEEASELEDVAPDAVVMVGGEVGEVSAAVVEVSAAVSKRRPRARGKRA